MQVHQDSIKSIFITTNLIKLQDVTVTVSAIAISDGLHQTVTLRMRADSPLDWSVARRGLCN